MWGRLGEGCDLRSTNDWVALYWEQETRYGSWDGVVRQIEDDGASGSGGVPRVGGLHDRVRPLYEDCPEADAFPHPQLVEVHGGKREEVAAAEGVRLQAIA